MKSHKFAWIVLFAEVAACNNKKERDTEKKKV